MAVVARSVAFKVELSHSFRGTTNDVFGKRVCLEEVRDDDDDVNDDDDDDDDARPGGVFGVRGRLFCTVESDIIN